MVEQPYSVPAERAVLGAMITSPDAVYEGVARLTEDDFFVRDHRIIFNAIKEVHLKGLKTELVNIVDQLVLDNKMNELSDPNYIYNILDDTITPSTIDEYIRIVQDKTTLRRLVNLSDEVANNWNNIGIKDIGDYVADLENRFLNITKSRNVGDFKETKEVIDVVKEKIINSTKNPGGVIGTPSGYKDLDNITHGFQKGDLIILAARPGMGKTALALNFAMNAAINHKIPVGIFSLEMPAEQLMQRMLAATSGVNGSKIVSYNLNDKEWSKIEVGINKLSDAPIYIDDTSGAKIGDIKTKAKKLKAKCDNLGLIIVDYLQLVTTAFHGKGDVSRQQEVSEISRSLKEMARDLKVPVIALSQFSRKVEDRPNNEPRLSDLRESGSIEQDADVVLFIHRDEYYKSNKEKSENDDKNVVNQIYIAKHRNGAQGKIELLFLKEIGLFSSLTKREE